MAESKSAMARIERKLVVLKEAFDEFDKDKNGKICKVELRGLLQKVGIDPGSDKIEHLLDIMDKDRSGDICFFEFSTAFMEIEAKKRDLMMIKLKEMFDKYDKNKDGFITKDELRAVSSVNTPEKEIDALMNRLDKNKDGKISFEEFVMGMS